MNERKPGATWTVEEGLATVRLAREHGNAIDPGLVEDLIRVFSELEADPAVRGVLLASSGKLFCPGLDLKVLTRCDRPAMADFLGRFSQSLLALYTFPKPLVAALSGAALAGGCVLALTADWRILRRGAPIGLNEIRVGLPLPWSVAQLLAASVAPARLEEVALFGRNYSDQDAIQAGLAHEVLDDDDRFEQRCLARLAELASRETTAFARTKHYLRSATAERMRAGEARDTDTFLDCWFSPVTRQRIEHVVAGLGSRKG